MVTYFTLLLGLFMVKHLFFSCIFALTGCNFAMDANAADNDEFLDVVKTVLHQPKQGFLVLTSAFMRVGKTTTVVELKRVFDNKIVSFLEWRENNPSRPKTENFIRTEIDRLKTLLKASVLLKSGATVITDSAFSLTNHYILQQPDSEWLFPHNDLKFKNLLFINDKYNALISKISNEHLLAFIKLYTSAEVYAARVAKELSATDNIYDTSSQQAEGAQQLISDTLAVVAKELEAEIITHNNDNKTPKQSADIISSELKQKYPQWLGAEAPDLQLPNGFIERLNNMSIPDLVELLGTVPGVLPEGFADGITEALVHLTNGFIAE